MNNILVNTAFLNENEISVNELMSLINYADLFNDFNYFSANIEQDKLELQRKGFIKSINNQVILRQKAYILLESVIIEDKPVKTSKKPQITDDFTDFIKQYRLLFKGLKLGSMGSQQGCTEKMKRWLDSNPDYTKEQVINATRNYINSLENYRFLQQADYFIYKKDPFGESSKLSAFIDEEDVPTDGWSSELK